MDDEFRLSVTERYTELYELMTGKTFTPVPTDGFDQTLDEIARAVR